MDIPGYDEETLKSMVAEAEEVTKSIADYGVLDEDDITAIQNRPEPKAYVPEPNQTESGTAAHQAAHVPPMATATHPTTNTDTIKIECPECGGDVWLSKEQLRVLMS